MIIIKNLAQFKRAMTLGSQWKFYSNNNDNEAIIRTCVVSQSNSFALDNHPNCKDKTEASWLDYPKADALLFIQEDGESTKIRLDVCNGLYLIYQPIENGEV